MSVPQCEQLALWAAQGPLTPHTHPVLFCARASHGGVTHGTSWLARYKAVHGITQVIIISQRHPATLLRQRRNGDGRRRGLEEFVLVNWRLGDLAVTRSSA